MIRFDHVSFSYPGGAGVSNLTFAVLPGECLALLGPSGSGKSTTLKLMNRLLEPNSGKVFVDGIDTATVDPHALRRGIGFAAQGAQLFPHLTVAQNISVVPELLNWPLTQRQARVSQLLIQVGLDESFAPRLPVTLSGGQAQRVSLARALAVMPKVMLLDEAFGAVDPLLREALQREYRGLHTALELTTVMVTHDVTEALLMADRLAIFDAGQLVACGTAAELESHASEQVQRLLGAPKRQAEAVRQRFARGSA